MKRKSLLIISVLIFCGSLFANDSIPKKSFTDYVGRYKLPENQYAEYASVEMKNDTLYVVADMGSIQLIYIQDETFEIPDFNVQVKFVRDETKRKVLGVRIIYTDGDVDMFGKKETD